VVLPQVESAAAPRPVVVEAEDLLDPHAILLSSR
jgi:hypothetical protein